jgi:hypothetical protein
MYSTHRASPQWRQRFAELPRRRINAVAHGEAQLRGRSGASCARIIMDTSGAKIWLSGISDTDTLNAVSPLCCIIPMKETSTALEMPPRPLRPTPRYALIIRDANPLPLRLCVATEGGARPLAAGGGKAAPSRPGGRRP